MVDYVVRLVRTFEASNTRVAQSTGGPSSDFAHLA